MIPLRGSCTSKERLCYSFSLNFLFMVEIVVGTFDSQCWQSVRSSPVNPREAHWLETSLNEPFHLHMPPSSALKTMVGLNGVAAIACWSGCRLTPWVSIVMSVKLTPASSER